MTLLLASSSEIRLRMLRAAGLSVSKVASDLDEDRVKAELRRSGLGAPALAEALAVRKALGAPARADDIVIGADQTLELEDGSMLDKPQSREDALDQLRSLGGCVHRLHAAAALVRDGKAIWSAVETVRMTVRPLGEAFLQDYLDREYDAVRWTVGAYRIEGYGAQLFEQVEGSHFAVLGLPLLPLLCQLRVMDVLVS